MSKIKKYLITPDRRRTIQGGFAFIPHKLLVDGHLSNFSKDEIALYLLLVLAADKDGLSYFSHDKICNILKMNLEEYLFARNLLIEKSYATFDGSLFQVLSLPDLTHDITSRSLKSDEDYHRYDRATIQHALEK